MSRREHVRGLGITQRLARSNRAVVALVAVALLVTAATFVAVLLYDQPQLDRDRDGRNSANLAHQGMLDQETGVRGYLLSGDRAFLGPYDAGVQELAEGNAQLSASLGQNSTIAPLILQTRLAEQQWTVGWAQPLAAGGVPPGGVAGVVLDHGKSLFDAYRAADDSLVAGITAQSDAVRRNQLITLRVSAGVQIGLFAVVLVVALVQYRRLRAAVVGPLASLMAVMRRAGEGDLQARAPEAGPADLREVAAGLNQMIAALAEERTLRASRETEVMYQATKLSEVLDMARNLAGSLNLRYVAQAAAAHAVSVSGFELATIWLADDEQAQLTAAEAAGRDGPIDVHRDPVQLNHGCVGRAARLGRAVSDEGGGADDPPGARAVMAVPMSVGARVVGVIELSSAQEYTMPPAALPIVETLASHAGTAIEAARLHQRTEELSQVDALTRLYNRRRFEADIARECKSSRRYDRRLSFCMVDVDHFKRYNDRFGHQRGDEVLEEVARLLSTGIRGSDSAYRYGGEEFALLLRDTPADAAVALCERLRVRIAGRFHHGDAITASFGVAMLESEMREPADLVKAADRALYRAKAAGRDRVVRADATGVGDVLELPPR